MNRKRWSLHCITQLPRSIDYLDCAPRSFVNLLPIRQERRSNIESQLLPRKSVLFWWKSVGFVFVAGHYEIGALVLCGLQFWGRALNERWFQVWLPEEEATRFWWKEIKIVLCYTFRVLKTDLFSLLHKATNYNSIRWIWANQRAVKDHEKID